MSERAGGSAAPASRVVNPQVFLVRLLNGLGFEASRFFLASGFPLIFGLMGGSRRPLWRRRQPPRLSASPEREKP
jgi:hypothetical protein